MIENFFSSWIESIIVVVFLSIIIEFFLTDSKYKKIVNIVLNIYLVLVIMEPILENKIDEFDFDVFLESEVTQEAGNIDLDDTIQEVFKINIENQIKKIGEENSIKIEKVDIDILDEASGEIKLLKIYVKDSSKEIEDAIRKKVSEDFEISYEKIIVKGA